MWLRSCETTYPLYNIKRGTLVFACLSHSCFISRILPRPLCFSFCWRKSDAQKPGLRPISNVEKQLFTH